MTLGSMAGLHSQKSLSKYGYKGQNKGSDLRDEGSGSVIYRPYPYPLLKHLSGSSFLLNI
jgi:hypothetical protein